MLRIRCHVSAIENGIDWRVLDAGACNGYIMGAGWRYCMVILSSIFYRVVVKVLV